MSNRGVVVIEGQSGATPLDPSQFSVNSSGFIQTSGGGGGLPTHIVSASNADLLRYNSVTSTWDNVAGSAVTVGNATYANSSYLATNATYATNAANATYANNALSSSLFVIKSVQSVK